jgi:tol-pal system protein YbgF
MEDLTNQNASLQYQVDSLTAENRRMMQQVQALASENSSLTARAGELEMQLRENRTPAPAPPPQPPVHRDMSSPYADALAQFRTRDFSGAMAKFEQILKGGVQDDLSDNCHYWIGECLYSLGKYSDAIYHFETVIGFTNSEKKDDAMLMIGNSHAAAGNKAAARDAYNRLISSYPASPYVSKAREKLSKL